MQSYKGRFEPTRFEDLTVTVDFHCHSACRFCIVQEGMNLFKGVSLERWKQVVDDNGKAPRYRRVTFTGGEVTLEKKLLEYVDYAREHGGFEHIRLQTNGRLMANPAYAKKLVDAGIDEFFVSMHGHDAATQDDISQRKGSFAEALQGLHNLRALGVTLMTNTVLHSLNVAHLTQIVELLAPLQPERMEFWNYLPMEDYADERELLAPMAQLGPALRQALSRAKALGVPCAVKYVPQCLLGEHAGCLDNTQPDVVIVEGFYDVYPRFSCLWEAKCEHAETCLGLTHPYIAKFGWEKDLLVPTPRTRPWHEPEDGPAVASDRPRKDGEQREIHHPEWVALLGNVLAEQGIVLSELQLDRRRCIYRLVTPLGSSVELLLTRRTESGPALVRSKSFDLMYRGLHISPEADDERERALLAGVIKAAAQSIVQRDRGDHILDERKGLVGAEALRRRPQAELAE